MLAGTVSPRGLLEREADTDLVALNLSAALLADELLALPAPAAARRVADLIWDGEAVVPPGFLEHVGRGRRLALASVLMVREPLAAVRETWRPLEVRLRRVLGEPLTPDGGRSRFEALRDALLDRPRSAALGGQARRSLEPRAEEVRAAAAAARRLLSRVAALNRALLRPALTAEAEPWGAPPARPPSEGLLDALAHSLPALAEPDFQRLALAVEGRAPRARGPGLDEILRHRALCAGLAAVPAPAARP
jgi:hypothetical protein